MLFVFRRAPYGTIYGQEALDVLMMGAAFDQTVCAAFIDDGVYQLKRGQNPSVSGMKHFTKAYGALDDFGVAEVLIECESLESRGLRRSDLIEIPRDDGQIPAKELAAIMDRQDVVLQF